jgi:hypothetical protein
MDLPPTNGDEKALFNRGAATYGGQAGSPAGFFHELVFNRAVRVSRLLRQIFY